MNTLNIGNNEVCPTRHNSDRQQVPFLALPKPVIGEIIKRLSNQEIGKSALVCKKFSEVCKKEPFWQSVFHFRNPQTNPSITTEYLAFLKSTYRDLVKNSEIFVPNVKNKKFNYQSYDLEENSKQQWLFAKNRYYKHDADGIQVFDPILGKDFMLAPESTAKESLKWATDDRVLTVSSDSNGKAYKLWNTETRKCIVEDNYFDKNNKEIFKDENYFVTWTENGDVKIWNLQSGKNVVLQHKFCFEKKSVMNLANAKKLIGFEGNYCWMRTENNGVVICNMKTLNEIAIGNGVSTQDWLGIKDSSLYQRSGESMKAWDAETGECFFELKPNPARFEIWDPRKKSCVCQLDHGEAVTEHKIYGNRVMTVSNNFTKIWDLETGYLLHTLAQTMHVMDTKRKVVGKLLLAGESSGKLNIWNMETGQLWRSFQVSEQDEWFNRWFEMNGNFLFVANESIGTDVQIYDLDSNCLLHNLNINEMGAKEYSIHGNCLIVKSLDWQGDDPIPFFIEIFDFKNTGSSTN